MGLPYRARVGERWYLDLPGVSTTEAYVFAFVEDTSGSDLRSDPSCDDTCSCCPDNFEPRIRLELGDRRSCFELKLYVEEPWRGQSLHALDTLIAEPWADYGLLDSGHGRKLERYGAYRFIRPEPQAMWAPASADWHAHGEFVPGSDEEGGGKWRFDRPVPRDGWELGWEEVRFRAQCTPFRHLAFFPDMAPQWAWMRERLGPSTGSGQAAEALNLFGYTGVGTLAMSAAGARLTHVDASRKSVEAGKANADLRPLTSLVMHISTFDTSSGLTQHLVQVEALVKADSLVQPLIVLTHERPGTWPL